MPRSSSVSNGYNVRIRATHRSDSKIAAQVMQPRRITAVPAASSLLDQFSFQRSDLVMLGLSAIWCVYGLTERLLHI